MKCKIDQIGMSNNKWRILEFEDDKNPIRETVRCPFDTCEEALQRAKEISEIREEELEALVRISIR